MDSCSPIFFTTTDINYSDNRRFEDSVAGVEELPNQFTYDLAAVDAVQAVGLELPKDKDDSTLYPRLSSAAIATYRELNALEASVQDVAFNNTDPRLEE
ncbi:hypothetical protein H4Q26_009435 [Puccinia striiformis f. sp. tritici PST-130]|nr:hypothetical protein H4Q26_009435 [Puccinia striiformis f. sp. tritici PST-130]